MYVGLITLLSEFGLGTAALAVRELSVRQLEQLNGLAALLGLFALLPRDLRFKGARTHRPESGVLAIGTVGFAGRRVDLGQAQSPRLAWAHSQAHV